MVSRLQDLIALKEIQDLLQSFDGNIKASIAIVDKDANVLAAIGEQKVCTKFHPHDAQPHEKCGHIHANIFAYSGNGKSDVIYKCPQGLVTIALPIKVNENHVASFIISQFFSEQPDTELYKAQAKEYGFFDGQTHLEAIAEIPILTGTELQCEVDLFKKICDVLAAMAEQRIKEKQTEEKLRAYRESMEQLTIKRNDKLQRREMLPSKQRKTICVVDRDRLNAADQKTLATDESQSGIKVQVLRPEGEQRTAFVCAEAHRRENSEVVHTVGLARDITEQAPLDQTLPTSREKLSMAVELARLGPWERNPETDLFEFGDEFYAIYGTSVAREGRFMAPEVYAREFVHPDDAWIVQAERQRALLFTERYYSSQLEHRIIRRDGEVRMIIVRANIIKDATGKIVKCYGANQDITEQKRMEEALRVSREKLALAAELAHLGSWEYDPETNLFEFIDEFYAICGTDAAREGRFMSPDVYIREFVHNDDVWIVTAARDRAFLSTEKCYSDRVEHRIIRRDGEVRTVVVRSKVIKDAAGKIVKCYGAIQDITEQKSMEEALRTSRENLSLAVELARLGPWEYNLETNVFEFGDEFYAIYGTDTAREGCTMAPDVYARELMHPDEAWRVEAEVSKVLSSAEQCYPHQLETRIVRRDGEVRTVAVRVNVIRDADGKIIRYYGVNQDITEQKALEEALRTSMEKLSLAAELARMGPWEVNLETNVFEFGDEFYALYGTDVAREGRFMALDVYVREFVHPDDRWMLEAEANKVLSFTERYYSSELEHRIIRRDGEVRTIAVRAIVIRDDAGNIIRWFGVNQDITERIQAEKGLKERDRLLLAVDGLWAGVWDWDMVNNRIFYDAQWKAIIGYEEEELTDNLHEWRSRWHPDDAGYVEQTMHDYLEGKTEKFEVEHRLRHKDGTYRWILTTGKISRGFDGRPLRWTGSNIDITQRKRVEELTQENETKLRDFAQAIPDGSYIMDEDGRYIEAFGSVCSFLSLTNEEMVGCTVHDIFSGSQTDLFLKDIRQTILSGTQQYYVREVTVGQETRIFEVRIAPMNYTVKGKKTVVVVVTDSTERRITERMLQFTYELRRRSDFLNDWVNGITEEDEKSIAAANTFGLDFSQSLFCCLIGVRGFDGRAGAGGEAEGQMRKDNIIHLLNGDPNCIVWDCRDSIGIICQAKECTADTRMNDRQMVDGIREKIRHYTADLSIIIGVSEVLTGPGSLMKSYQQAWSALMTVRSQDKNSQGIVFYKDSGINQLLAGYGGKEHAREFVEKTIGKLIAYDYKKGTDFLDTLENILRSANLKEVAKKMFLHHKTIVLRKQRIERILGQSIDQFEVRLALAAAIKLHRLNEVLPE